MADVGKCECQKYCNDILGLICPTSLPGNAIHPYCSMVMEIYGQPENREKFAKFVKTFEEFVSICEDVRVEAKDALRKYAV